MESAGTAHRSAGPARAGLSRRKRSALRAVAASLCLLPLLTAADTEPAREDDLFDLTLNELLEITVTSVSKRPEPLSTAAAAVFVITSEDIARAGITTIPEALRLAPGMEVAQIDGNKWAVSARGYNGRFSNNDNVHNHQRNTGTCRTLSSRT